MPIDSFTEALIDYGALGLFILFLLYREWANSTERKELKSDHDRQKQELIGLLTESQNKRIEEMKQALKDISDVTVILGNVTDAIKAKS